MSCPPRQHCRVSRGTRRCAPHCLEAARSPAARCCCCGAIGVLAPPCCCAGEARGEGLCRSTTAFCHLVVGILLPVAHSVYMWRPKAHEPASAAAPAAGLRGRARRAAAACDRALAMLYGKHGGWTMRAVVLLYLSAVTWQACSIHAGLGWRHEGGPAGA